MLFVMAVSKLRFCGKYQALQHAALFTRIYGDWSDYEVRRGYRTETGAVVIWWPTTGGQCCFRERRGLAVSCFMQCKRELHRRRILQRENPLYLATERQPSKSRILTGKSQILRGKSQIVVFGRAIRMQHRGCPCRDGIKTSDRQIGNANLILCATVAAARFAVAQSAR
jgi:hypothetical protein